MACEASQTICRSEPRLSVNKRLAGMGGSNDEGIEGALGPLGEFLYGCFVHRSGHCSVQLYRLRLGNNPIPEIFVEGLGSEHIDGDFQEVPQSVPDRRAIRKDGSKSNQSAERQLFVDHGDMRKVAHGAHHMDQTVFCRLWQAIQVPALKID